MKSIFKHTSAAVCAIALAGTFAISAFAEEYGQAGIEWMVKDFWWEHRNTVGSEALTEMEDDQVTCHMEDVSITGNGTYQVMMSGFAVAEEDREAAEIGNFGVAINFDIEEYPDFAMTLDEAVFDGVTYTFNEQPELEDTNVTEHIMKIKNPWGSPADTTPEMTNKPWETTDPITITFTISGLPEDKLEDNPDEVIVYDFVAEKPIWTPESEDNSEAEEEAAPEEEEDGAEEAGGEEAGETAEASEESSPASADTKEDTEEESSNTGLIVGIAVAAVAVIGVIVALVSKKKK